MAVLLPQAANCCQSLPMHTPSAAKWAVSSPPDGWDLDLADPFNSACFATRAYWYLPPCGRHVCWPCPGQECAFARPRTCPPHTRLLHALISGAVASKR